MSLLIFNDVEKVKENFSFLLSELTIEKKELEDEIKFKKFSDDLRKVLLEKCEAYRELTQRAKLEVLGCEEGWVKARFDNGFTNGRKIFEDSTLGWCTSDYQNREVDQYFDRGYGASACAKLQDMNICKKDCPSACMSHSKEHPAHPFKLLAKHNEIDCFEDILAQISGYSGEQQLESIKFAEKILNSCTKENFSKLQWETIVSELKKKTKLSKTVLNNSLKDLTKKEVQERNSVKSSNILDIGELKVPQGYRIAGNGVFQIHINDDGYEFETQICSSYLYISGYVADGEGKDLGYILNFNKFGKDMTMPVPAYSISAFNELAKLSNSGIPANQINAYSLVLFLEKFIAENRETFPMFEVIKRPGWFKNVRGVEGYALNNRAYYPTEQKHLLIDLGKACTESQKGYFKNGNEDLWIDTLNWIVSRSPFFIYLFGVLASSLFIRKLGIDPYMVHIWADSSKGKTTAQGFLLSGFGLATRKFLAKTWNSTKAGLEARLKYSNDLVASFDDLSEAKDENIGTEIIYTLSNGQARQRATISGESQSVDDFCTIGLSTGEGPLTKSFDKSGKLVRVLEYNTSPLSNFSEIEVNKIKNVYRESFGHLLDPLVNELVKIFNDDDLVEDFIESFKELKQDFSSRHSDSSSLLNRTIESFASAKLGAILIHKLFPKINFNKESIDQAIEEAVLLQRKRLQSTNRVHHQAYQFLWNFILANRSRFKIDEEGYTEQYGKLKVSIKDDIGGKIDCCSILELQLDKILREGGFDPNGIKQFMLADGMIFTRRGQRPVVNLGDNRSVRAYSFSYQEAVRRGVLEENSVKDVFNGVLDENGCL